MTRSRLTVPFRIFCALSFVTWLIRVKQPQVQISENMILKVDEIQKPIIGGAWTTKTDFGRLEIKIVPFWTGEAPALVSCVVPAKKTSAGHSYTYPSVCVLLPVVSRSECGDNARLRFVH